MEAAVKHRSSKARDDLALKLGAILLRCMGPRGNEMFRVIDESGLTFAQMKVLIEVASPDEEPVNVTTLSEELGISLPSASRAADGLVRKKLATRVEDPNDRRVRRLALTAKGDRLANRIISARLATLDDFTASLDAGEREKLETALDALLKRPEIAEIYATYERKVSR